MRVKLYNARHELTKTLAAGGKDFARWLEDSADAFFARGGYAEIWNDREVFCFDHDVYSRDELKKQIKALAA
jgi:hypothetical protein